jgi:diguanylate cyclase (GGDEF)-like protein
VSRLGVPPADERDAAADARDQLADERDKTGDERDHTGDERDEAADQRDRTADQRDVNADERDRAADERDSTAELAEMLSERGPDQDEVTGSSLARREAASDRRQATEDRRAGATLRRHAERDRDAALADRGEGAGERVKAGLDRAMAQADRGASAQERRSASIDGLTGVFQRGAGLAELHRDIARARAGDHRLSVAFVDVDRLKVVNDSFGHAAGDRMLVEVARVLKSQIRSYDLIMRYGGDEFVCALPGLSGDDARERLARVNKALAAAPGQGSVTVGVAELRPDDLTEDLVARADAELYLARLKQRRDRPSERAG